MQIQYLGHTETSVAFRLIEDTGVTDFGVFNSSYTNELNREEYDADQALQEGERVGVELQTQVTIENIKDIYFDGVDFADQKAFEKAVLSYLTNEQGMSL